MKLKKVGVGRIDYVPTLCRLFSLFTITICVMKTPDGEVEIYFDKRGLSII